ncbi:hypothetical protein B0H10DRAFT_2213876 [Mycena sp. CBHHK59/15]|nr:hypothetical protein B0H10DRAFT_2244491 [Mycena sp. CBHHK59/15]KAJ6608078.1 hypothetical protein B0H10DRAFT_2439253 [Mycena sp. CBHHK59/15]KAJ6623203.1 hypothetical protein B0H10DRAFT_2213876 [Mycena sp. CBHHK59/15]
MQCRLLALFAVSLVAFAAAAPVPESSNVLERDVPTNDGVAFVGLSEVARAPEPEPEPAPEPGCRMYTCV